MKKIFAILFLMVLVNSLAFSSPIENQTKTKSNVEHDTQNLDQIVAIINEDVVTKSELRRAVTMLKMQAAAANVQVPQDEILQKQILEQLINKKLQIQLAKQAGLTISDKKVEETILNIAKQNNISVNELYNRLNHEGMTTDAYRREIKEQLILQKLQQQEVINHIAISDDEIDFFLKSKVWEKDVEKEYRLKDILIPLTDSPGQNEIVHAKAFAENVIKQLKQGRSFAELAHLFSKSSFKIKQDDLGFKKLTEIPSAFNAYVMRMENKKDLAGPIQTGNGLHIIQLTDIRAVGKKPSPPSRKQVQQIILQRKFQQALNTWLSKLRSQAFIVTNPER